MKRLALGVLSVAFALLAGCNSGSVESFPSVAPPPGGGGSQSSVVITEFPTTDTLLTGLTIASDGNVYASSTTGLDIFTPESGTIHQSAVVQRHPLTWPVITNSSVPTGPVTSVSGSVSALGTTPGPAAATARATTGQTPMLATLMLSTQSWTQVFGPIGDLFEDVVDSPDGTPWITADRPTPSGLLGYIFTTKAGCTGPVLGDALGAITLGADNFVWFASDPTLNSQTPSQIFRLNPANGQVVNTYTLGTNSIVSDLSAGPDGALWYADSGLNEIGRVATDGAITHYPVPASNSGLFGIANGCDGALWFTERKANKIGRITTSGTITEYTVPTANAGLGEIVGCLGNALYFVETHAIGKVVKT